MVKVSRYRCYLSIFHSMFVYLFLIDLPHPCVCDSCIVLYHSNTLLRNFELILIHYSFLCMYWIHSWTPFPCISKWATEAQVHSPSRVNPQSPTLEQTNRSNWKLKGMYMCCIQYDTTERGVPKKSALNFQLCILLLWA